MTTQMVDHNVEDGWKWAMRILALVSLVLVCSYGGGAFMTPEPSTANAEKEAKAAIGDCLCHDKLMYFNLVLLVLGLGIWNPQVQCHSVLLNHTTTLCCI